MGWTPPTPSCWQGPQQLQPVLQLHRMGFDASLPSTAPPSPPTYDPYNGPIEGSTLATHQFARPQLPIRYHPQYQAPWGYFPQAGIHCQWYGSDGQTVMQGQQMGFGYSPYHCPYAPPNYPAPPPQGQHHQPHHHPTNQNDHPQPDAFFHSNAAPPNYAEDVQFGGAGLHWHWQSENSAKATNGSANTDSVIHDGSESTGSEEAPVDGDGWVTAASARGEGSREGEVQEGQAREDSPQAGEDAQAVEDPHQQTASTADSDPKPVIYHIHLVPHTNPLPTPAST